MNRIRRHEPPPPGEVAARRADGGGAPLHRLRRSPLPPMGEDHCGCARPLAPRNPRRRRHADPTTSTASRSRATARSPASRECWCRTTGKSARSCGRARNPQTPFQFHVDGRRPHGRARHDRRASPPDGYRLRRADARSLATRSRSPKRRRRSPPMRPNIRTARGSSAKAGTRRNGPRALPDRSSSSTRWSRTAPVWMSPDRRPCRLGQQQGDRDGRRHRQDRRSGRRADHPGGRHESADRRVHRRRARPDHRQTARRAPPRITTSPFSPRRMRC